MCPKVSLETMFRKKKQHYAILGNLKVHYTLSTIGFLISHFQVVENWRWRVLEYVPPLHTDWFEVIHQSSFLDGDWFTNRT